MSPKNAVTDLTLFTLAFSTVCLSPETDYYQVWTDMDICYNLQWGFQKVKENWFHMKANSPQLVPHHLGRSAATSPHSHFMFFFHLASHARNPRQDSFSYFCCFWGWRKQVFWEEKRHCIFIKRKATQAEKSPAGGLLLVDRTPTDNPNRQARRTRQKEMCWQLSVFGVNVSDMWL